MQQGASSYKLQLSIIQCTKRIIVPPRPSSGFHVYTKRAIAVQAQGLRYYIGGLAMHDTSSTTLQALVAKLSCVLHNFLLQLLLRVSAAPAGHQAVVGGATVSIAGQYEAHRHWPYALSSG
jgi:hypothetical protein